MAFTSRLCFAVWDGTGHMGWLGRQGLRCRPARPYSCGRPGRRTFCRRDRLTRGAVPGKTNNKDSGAGFSDIRWVQKHTVKVQLGTQCFERRFLSLSGQRLIIQFKRVSACSVPSVQLLRFYVHFLLLASTCRLLRYIFCACGQISWCRLEF